MNLILLVMLAAAMATLFACGYYAGLIKERYGKNWLLAIPITIAILMFNVIFALSELMKAERWQ